MGWAGVWMGGKDGKEGEVGREEGREAVRPFTICVDICIKDQREGN